MSFSLDGFVLKPARSSTSNADTTGESNSHVSREHILPTEMLSLGYNIVPTSPVEPYTDMYTASILNNDVGTETYAVFATTNSQFSDVESVVLTAEDTVTVIGNNLDYYTTFRVTEPNNRTMVSIEQIVIRRGDTQVEITCTFESVNALTGVVKLDTTSITNLNGGFSTDRMDQFVSCSYRLSRPKYYWSKNDNVSTRFYWDGNTSKWSPIKGKSVQDVGEILQNSTYKLNPPLLGLSTGETLPIDFTTTDSFCFIRYGLYGDSTSTPLHTLIVSDELVDAGEWRADLGWNSYEAVIGVNNSVLLLNGSFIEANSGLKLWFNTNNFSTTNTGNLGLLQELNTQTNENHYILSPIPLPIEHPLIKIGNRTYLEAIQVDSDNDLPIPNSIPEGTVYWSRTTGKLSFSSLDINKSRPSQSEYKRSYLLSNVYYDGVVLTSKPVPLREPTPVLSENGDPVDGTVTIDNNGKYYLPKSLPLPAPGKSGVMLVPDTTGDLPNTSLDPQTRGNGSGLVRTIKQGDSFFFNTTKRYTDTQVIEYQQDLQSNFKVKGDTVQVSRMVSSTQPSGYTDTSLVRFKRKQVKDQPLFFIQSNVVLASYSNSCKIYTRKQEPYICEGGEQLVVDVDNTTTTITLTTGTYSAFEMAVYLNSIVPNNPFKAFRGYLYVEGVSSLEIGYNPNVLDLSGHSVLGLLPTWKVDITSDTHRWLPDSGVSLNLYRSPTNLTDLNGSPDTMAYWRLEDTVIQKEIISFPFQAVDQFPLEDLPGFEEDVHFRVVLGGFPINIPNYGFNAGVGVIYDYDESRLLWTEFGKTLKTNVDQLTNTLQLNDVSVIPQTLSSLTMGDSDFGLYYKDVYSSPQELVIGENFLLEDEGASGQASLIQQVAVNTYSGSGGQGLSVLFSNPVLSNNSSQNTQLQADLFNLVNVGNLLDLQTTDSKGVYRVTNKSLVGGICTLTVDPPFPYSFTNAKWKIYNTKDLTQLDESLVANVKMFTQESFLEEPIQVKVLSPCGTRNTTLEANITSISTQSKTVSVRFGIVGLEVPIYTLVKGYDLGVIRNTNLNYPDITSKYFTESSASNIFFQFRVGDGIFNSNNGLLLWDNVTPDPDRINIVSSTGEIQVGDNVLATYSGNTLYLDELFRLSSNLVNEAELQLSDGVLNIPDTVDGDVECYFVVEQIVKESFDVQVSPLNGGVFLQTPLLENDLVEISYYLADDYGDKLQENGSPVKVTEFLSHIIRLEECTRVDEYNYSFNLNNKAVDTNFNVSVWVDSRLYNLWDNNYSIDFNNNLIVFNIPIEDSAVVQINYGMLSALGGEQAFGTSQFPLYRKPISLKAGENTFEVEGDRTLNFPVDHCLAIGSTLFYIDNSVYDSITNTTLVTVFPIQEGDVGSVSPGNDEPLLVSDYPVRNNSNFMVVLATTYLPIDKGSDRIVIVGNVSQVIKDNYVLDINGYPFLVGGVSLTEDGSYTVISLNKPSSVGLSGGTIKVSLTPLIFNIKQFLLPYLPVLGEPTAVLTTGNGIGRALTQGKDYNLNSNGVVTLKEALQPLEYLYVSYTKYIQVQPLIQENAELYPEYYGQYLILSEPNEDNRIEGGRLKGSYSFYSPDSFSFQIQPLQDYVVTVVDEILSSTSGTGTGVTQATTCIDTSEQGNLGLYGEVNTLLNKDRACRSYIEFYNDVIVGFEQVLETISGKFIGDRDGKFRFNIGHGRKYTPEGFENSITGNINPRLIWRSIVEEWAENLQGAYFEESDPIVDPKTSTETNPTNRPNSQDGRTPNTQTLDKFITLQRQKVRNDMDDRVLIGFARNRGWAALSPKMDVAGIFKYMSQPSKLSRLFPSQTKHFSRLFPGLEYSVDTNDGSITGPGYFSPGRTIEVTGTEPDTVSKEKVSTKNTTIGTVSNPALGTITGIVDVNIERRYGRGRVWAYYPNGNDDLDSAYGIVTTGVATIVVTPLYLSELPIDTETGFPDSSQLLSNGGTLIDVNTGDADLDTPGIEIGNRVIWGTPDGKLYDLITGESGLYVNEVLSGCVITLVDKDGNSISGDDIVVSETQTLQDIISSNNGFGDTLLATAPKDFDSVPADNESATVEELNTLINVIPDFRIDFDIKLDKNSGELRDATLPNSDDDGINIRSIFGQNPPEPLTPIEGIVNFQYTGPNPVQLPCLLGQDRDDSGDVQVPYLKPLNTELDVLGSISTVMGLILQDTNYSPKPSVTAFSSGYSYTIDYQYWDSVLPDEHRIIDGTYYAVQDGVHNPSTLYTTESLRPITSTGVYQTRSGIGSVRRGDIGFVQLNQPNLPVSMYEGIITVGDITDNSVELARYVYPTYIGDFHQYHLKGAYSHKGNSVSGVYITETIVGIDRTTTFEFSSVSGLTLQGLFNLFFNTNNVFNINLFDGAGGFVGTITFDQVLTGSTFWTYDTSATVVPHFLTSIMSFTGTTTFSVETNVSSMGPLQVLGLTPDTYYDFTIDLDTYITSETNTYTGGALTVGNGAGSTTCQIEQDLLTFSELIDLSTASPRNTYPFDGNTSYEMGIQLDVISHSGGFFSLNVNSKNQINGGDYLTYLERVGPDVNGLVPVGQPYLTTTDGTGRGRLRAMSWEYHHNTNWGVSDVSSIKLSLAPSSDVGTSTTRIYSGIGTIYDYGTYGGFARVGAFTWIQDLNNTDVSQVEAGDIVLVKGKVTNGTYLVRHAVEANGETDNSGAKLRGVKPEILMGTNTKLDLTFPVLDSFDSDTEVITLSNVVPVKETPNGSGFETNSRFFFILNPQYATWDGSYTLDEDSVYSCEGTISYDNNTQTGTITGLSGYRNASGGIILKGTFFNALSNGILVSGMKYVGVKQIDSTLPTNNCVGSSSHSATGFETHGGFQFITLTNKQSFHSLQPYKTFSSGVNTIVNHIGTPPVSSLAIYVPTPTSNNVFQEDSSLPVYGRRTLPVSTQTDGMQGVAVHISLESLTSGDWDTIHFDIGAPANNLQCLLPQDAFVLSDNIDTSIGQYGFLALGGIFCEPSFPKPVTFGLLTSHDNSPRVVSNITGLTPGSLVGFRQVKDFTTPPQNSEFVSVVVRRIRRFHTEQDNVTDLGTDLPFIYEIRQGVVDTASNKQLVAVSGTTLGGFKDLKVNIQSGDVVRLYDSNGNLQEENEVLKVVDDNTIKLKYQLMFTYSGEKFEVFLKNNLSPIEQSCEELLESITQEVVFQRKVSRVNSNEDGGLVQDFNVLQDTLVTDWSTEGVQEGDYIIVDPAGDLYSGNEKGYRPNGDVALTDNGQDKVGVTPDGITNVYVASKPSVTDDNRGFYRVGTLDTDNPSKLTVSGSSVFCGSDESGTDNVVFGGIEDYGLGLDYRYVVLPTISDSSITVNGKEGQQSLRPTARPVSDLYNLRNGVDIFKSIEPLAYRIIRPTGLITQDTIELVLFMRERMLSWIEEIQSYYNGSRGGTYYDFQKDDHLLDVGSPVDYSSGLGVYSNGFIVDIQGLANVAPFSNNNDCLSILDRRFWVLDTTLDYTSPVGVVEKYTSFEQGVGQVRPVLPDYIQDSLSLDEDLRGQRLAWINARSNVYNGTLQQAQRSVSLIEEEVQKQQDLAKQQQNSKGGGGSSCQ